MTNENDEISLKDLILKIRDYFKYLISKWVIILCFGILGGILGITYAYLKKPVYKATTTFVLEDEKGSNGMGSLAGLASIAGVDLGNGGGGIFQGENILELYKSRLMIEQALLTDVDYNGKKQKLVERYIDFNQWKEKWGNKPELLNLKFDSEALNKKSRVRDSLMGEIVKQINKTNLSATKPDKKLSTINVSVNATDEFFAKTFNDVIVENVNNFYLQTKLKKALQNEKILKQKTDSVRRVMNGAIYSAAKVSDATPNLNPTRQIQRAAPIQTMQFSAETNKSMLGELVKNLEMSNMAVRKETPLLQVIDMPIYPLEKEKLGFIKALVIGAFLFGFITVLILSIKQFLKKILSEE